MYARALVVFLLIASVEVLHGIARVLFIAPRLGDFPARQIAVFTGSALILLVAVATAKWIGATSRRQLAAIGLLWVLLMVGFEVTLGRFAFGLPWSRIGEDFDLAHGGLLPLGMLVLALAPLIAARLRQLPVGRQ
jgi:hypothetical protein